MRMMSDAAIMRGDLDVDYLLGAFKAHRVAVDIETTGLNWQSDQIGTVQIHEPRIGTAVVHELRKQPQRLMDLMTSVRIQKVFHHAPFDLRFMVHQWGIRPVNIADTKLAARVIEPNADHNDYSLAPLVKRHFNVDLDKSVRFTNWLAKDLSSTQVDYAAQDVKYLLPLLDALTDAAISAGVADLIEASYSYIPIRVATDVRGCGDVFSY